MRSRILFPAMMSRAFLFASLVFAQPPALVQFAENPKIDGIPEAPMAIASPMQATCLETTALRVTHFGQGFDYLWPALRSLSRVDIKSTCRRAQPIPGDKGVYRSCLDDEIQAQKDLSHTCSASPPVRAHFARGTQ